MKEFLKREAKEFTTILLYLLSSFLVVATFKALILAQLGINDFLHFYSVAIVLAFALTKIVVLAEKLPILRAFEHRPLFISVLYKAFMLAIIAESGSFLEEQAFAHITGHHAVTPIHPLILTITRLCAFILVFAALFLVRELDTSLGKGQVSKLLFSERKLQN